MVARCLLGLFLFLLTPGCMLSSQQQDANTEVYTMQHGGEERSYLLYVPPGCKAGEVMPLLVVLHGGHGSGRQVMRWAGFNKIAEREHFLAVYPNGIERNWNDGRAIMQYRSHSENIDDVGFVAALLDHLVQKFHADPTRLYVAGISNGAMMTLRVAAELSHKIAAASSVCGSLPRNLLTAFKPSQPVPLLLMNGTEDPLVPWAGGDVHFGRKKLGQIVSTRDTIALWVSRNGCRVEPAVSLLADKNPGDGCKVRQELYAGRDEVVLYEIIGGGHTWPGTSPYAPAWLIGKTCRDIEGSEVIWEFCKTHRKDSTQPTKKSPNPPRNSAKE